MQAHFPQPRWLAFKRTWAEEGMHNTVGVVLPLGGKPQTPDELPIAGHARRYTVDDPQRVRSQLGLSTRMERFVGSTQ